MTKSLDPKTLKRVLALVKKHASADTVDAISAELPKRQPRKPNTRAKARRVRFTEPKVRSLPTKAQQYLVWDSGTEGARGLAILVSPKGAKSYRAVFYFPGSASPHWLHLGRVGELSLEKARQLCRNARAKAREGIDPRAASAVKSDSFEAAVDAWHKLYQIGKKNNNAKSAASTRTLLLTHCAEWKPRPIATIRDTEIELLLARVRDGDGERRGAPYVANRLYAHLRTLFRWAAKRGKFTSPMDGVERPFDGAAARERSWFASRAADDAIKVFWKAADEIGGNEARCLKLLLLTGKRRTVTEKATWEQVDADWLWTPPKGSPNKRNHPVPLPALAQRILAPRQQSGPIFPGINLGPLEVKIREKIPDFFVHGLKHLVETKLGELRVPPHVRDLMLDHATKRGTGKVYDHHDYQAEIAEGFELWASHIEALVTAKGVRRLR